MGSPTFKFDLSLADESDDKAEDRIVSQAAFGRGIQPSQKESARPQKTPIEHRIDADRKLVFVKFGQRVSMRDIERYVFSLKSNANFHPDFSEIVDLTSVEEFDLGGDDFMKLADKVDPFAPEARRAFVARSSVQQHAARMHKILRVNRNFQIFSSMSAAEQWVAS